MSALTPPQQKNKQQQTNKRKIYTYCTTLRYQQSHFLKYLGVQHITYRMSFGVQLISVSIDSVSTLASMFRVDLLLSHYSVLCEAVY